MGYNQKDYYFNKAKREGLRARSSYKLIEIAKKFQLIKREDDVLDLGCAPGSWLQILKQLTHGRVVGIDIVSIKPVDRVEFIQGDIQDPKVQDQLKEKFNVVVSDVAPKTSGIQSKDKYISYELSRESFLIAKKVLKKGGNFLVKTFQSQDTENLVKEIQKDFKSVKRYTPESTRQGSKEIYIIAMELK